MYPSHRNRKKAFSKKGCMWSEPPQFPNSLKHAPNDDTHGTMEVMMRTLNKSQMKNITKNNLGTDDLKTQNQITNQVRKYEKLSFSIQTQHDPTVGNLILNSSIIHIFIYMFIYMWSSSSLIPRSATNFYHALVVYNLLGDCNQGLIPCFLLTRIRFTTLKYCYME